MREQNQESFANRKVFSICSLWLDRWHPFFRLLFLLFLLWGNIYHVPGKVQSASSFKHLPCPVRRCFCIPTRLVSGAGGGGLQTQAVASKLTPSPLPQMASPDQRQITAMENHVPYFPYFIYDQMEA